MPDSIRGQNMKSAIPQQRQQKDHSYPTNDKSESKPVSVNAIPTQSNNLLQRVSNSSH